MNNSDETLKNAPDNKAVLQAIADLSKSVAEVSNNVKILSDRFDKLENRFDKLENFVTAQFDAIQEGISYNSAKFDRLEAKFYEARSDISYMRADIKELTQVVRKKELV